jgi:cobalt-zinc-cadmium efflux system membrane fusion protein
MKPRTTLLTLLGVSLFTWACHTSAADTRPRSMPAAGEVWLSESRARNAGVAISTVSWEDLGGGIDLAGKITFDDQRVTHVFSPVSGRVVRLVASPGQRVAKGDPLAVLDSPDLGSAVSDLVKAEAAVAAAGRDFERQKELFAAKAVAQRDLEGAESAFRQAQAEFLRARSKARLLHAGSGSLISEQFVLRSPIGGEVIARSANPGVEVQGQYSGGTAVELFTVGELDRVWAQADAFEMDLPRIRAGAPVAVRLVAFPDRVFNGKVEWISGAVDPATRTAKVRCAIDNPERILKPEMYASVSVHAPGRAALAISRSAVLRMGGQTVVFLATGHAPDGSLRFERRPVRIDDEGDDREVAVLSGVGPGDRVVTAGGILLLGMMG